MQSFEMLEREWARFNDLDPAGMVACSSGTAALHLALESLELRKSSPVLVPDFTMIACARAVVLAGLSPVFVDCRHDLLVNWDLIEPDAAAAVLVVHVYGRRDAGIDSSGFRGLVIEDLAEAHGVKPSETAAAACWSFYKNKIVAGEEGGAAWFRNKKHANLARQLRTLGFSDAHDFDHVPRGHNYRMSNAHANLALGGLASVGSSTRVRRHLEAAYEKRCPAAWRMPARDAPWVYDLRIPGMSRGAQRKIVQRLNAAGIAARMSFLPMSSQLEFKGCRVLRDGESKALRASDEVFYLPVTPGQVNDADCESAFAIIGSSL